MRWGTLWLTAVLIATNSATFLSVDNTIDHLEKNNLQDNNVVADASTDADPLTTLKIEELSTNQGDAATLTDTIEDTSNTREVSEERSASREISDENANSVEQRTSEETSEETEVGSPPDDTDTREDEEDLVKSSSESVESGSHMDSEPERDSHAESSDASTNSESGRVDIEDLIVITKSGPVQGYMWQDRDNIISYTDIPYGAIVDYFQAATPANTWETIHDVKDHSKRCPQLEDDAYVGDIDCLTLSIFKPLNAEHASVLFHIHAENFNTGSGDPSIYGPEYLVTNEIILVLPNYRLGPLGFLCMQNETAPGNMALKDLTLALKWVKSNIEAFGGDPENIAVSGEGRSGALAGLLALSPTSKDYVSKVIAESGSFLSYWALDRDPTATAARLLERIQESQEGLSRIDISLTDVGLPVILTAAKGIEFKPCLEIDEHNDGNTFMTETPYKIIKSETFGATSFLLGSAMYAGVHEALLQTEDSIRQLNDDPTLLLPNDLSFNTLTSRSETGERVKKQYFGEEAISLEDVKHLSLCFTDIGYLGPGIRSARLLVAANATVYFYEFAYVGELNRVLHSVNHPVEGAVRGDIVGYLFTQDGMVLDEEREESKVVKSLTTMWTNFLKTGSPSTEDIEWTSLDIEVDDTEEDWLLIDSELSMKKGLYVERLPLWTEIYENHFIEGSSSHDLSPSVYTVLILQFVFWIGFWRNASHIY